MNLDDLREYVWRRLPMRRYMVGRAVVNDMVTLAVENWEAEYLGHADTEESREIVAMSIAAKVKRAHQWQSGKDPQEYSMVWLVLLGAVVSGVVQVLIRWWFEKQSHRVLMAGWQQELTR